MSELQQLLKRLLDAQHVIADGEKYVFTPKFYTELNGSMLPAKTGGHVFDIQKIEERTAQLRKMPQADWDLMFMNLIKEAQVPRVLEDNRGGLYYANKFSTDAVKVFKKAMMDQGILYEVLVKSTMLYYKGSVKFKKAIGNYFVQGDWRSDYEALLESAQQGESALHNHIKQETADAGRSQYKLG